MGETEVDKEWVLVIASFSSVEVFENSFAVPGASGFFGSASFGTILAHGELRVGGFVAVTVFAGTHRVVTGVVENGCHTVFGGVESVELSVIRRWGIVRKTFNFLGFSVGSLGQVPKDATGHDHVT